MDDKIITLKRKRITNLLMKIKNYKIVYISANICCGKTFEVQTLEEEFKEKFEVYKIKKEDNINELFIDNIKEKIRTENQNMQIIIIDDLHLLLDEKQRVKLAKYIDSTPDNIHFIITTRNVLTPEYKKFLVQNELVLITTKNLIFTKEDIKELYKKNDVQITNKEFEIILKRSYRISYGSYICIEEN